MWRNWCAVTRTGAPVASRTSQSASHWPRRRCSVFQLNGDVAVGVGADPRQQDRRRSREPFGEVVLLAADLRERGGLRSG